MVPSLEHGPKFRDCFREQRKRTSGSQKTSVEANTRGRKQCGGKKRGEIIGYSGHKHQKGSKIVGIMDNGNNVLAPMVCAPVNQSDGVLLPGSLAFLRRIIMKLKLDLNGVSINLDPGFDSKKNRRALRNLGLVPNVAENIRNRNPDFPKKGRPRQFNIKTYHSRSALEKLFAWQDTYRAMVIRYSRKQAHFIAQNLLTFTLINLRHVIRKSK